MGNNGPRTVFNYIQFVGDLVLVNVAIILAFLLRFLGELPDYNFEPYLQMIPFISIIAVVVFNFYGLYHTANKRWPEVLASLIISVIILMFLTISLSYMFGGFSFPRTVFFIAAIMQIIILGAWRWAILKLENRRRPLRRVIGIAPGGETGCLVNKLCLNYGQVLGIVSDVDLNSAGVSGNRQADNYQNLGALQDARDICLKHNPDIVIISGLVPDDVKEDVMRGALTYGWEVFVVPGLYEIMLSQTVVDQIEDTPVLKINSGANPGRDQVKRFMDCMLSLLVLLLLSPVMVLIALAVKINSPGPFLYMQERISMRGRPFMLYKFRTMKNNAEDKTGPVLSYGKKDTRVTRVGRFLRSARLDELPQLINVLKGDMSLVGPRPERPYFVKQFEKDIPGYTCRHMTKAGITGLAQVMSSYSTSTEDKLRYDLLYTKNRSPLFDIKILLQTMKVILMKNRAS